jgi:hypothetical protein
MQPDESQSTFLGNIFILTGLEGFMYQKTQFFKIFKLAKSISTVLFTKLNFRYFENISNFGSNTVKDCCR